MLRHDEPPGLLQGARQDAYPRSDNLAGSEHSRVVLGDYQVDKDAELEQPTRVALIDTRAASLRTLDLGPS